MPGRGVQLPPEQVGREEACRGAAHGDIPREEAAVLANNEVLTRSSLRRDKKKGVDSEGCKGGLAIIVRWGEVDEILAHSSLKWTVHSASLQPPHVLCEAGATPSSAARSNLLWVKMWRFPN